MNARLISFYKAFNYHTYPIKHGERERETPPTTMTAEMMRIGLAAAWPKTC
jgi:hypothetical protein